MSDLDTPLTDRLQDVLNELPPYTARGAKLITDAFTLDLMKELLALPKEAQYQFWTGAYNALCSNIRGATHPVVLNLIREIYTNGTRL